MPQPGWMTLCLRIAGIYNILWGAWAILLPNTFWDWLGMERPNYIFLWQCIGMIVGVYGVGYWVAAKDVARHWPIVLVGFWGKILGPIGFIDAHFIRDLVPLKFGVTLLTNDLIWWIPFALMLRHAFVVNTRRRDDDMMRDAKKTQQQPSGLREAMSAATTSDGVSLLALSERQPVLVVFLRHFGCTFCREALADIAKMQAQRESGLAAVRVAVVHMVDGDSEAVRQVAKFGVDAARVSDPQKRLYSAFALARGDARQLFGPRVFLRFLQAWRYGVGPLAGDGFQLGGAFLVRDGAIVRAYRHDDAADRPDYCELVTG
jgi:hypothetical protein